MRPDGTPEWWDPSEDGDEGDMSAEEEAAALGFVGQFARPGEEQ